MRRESEGAVLGPNNKRRDYFHEISLTATAVVTLIALIASTAEAGWRIHPRARIRGIYDSNIFLITDDDLEVTSARGDPGFPGNVDPVEDFLFELLGGVRLDYDIGTLSEGYVDYEYIAEQYLDERDENTENHRWSTGIDLYLNDLVGLELNYALEKHNQRPSAEYNRPDHLEHDANATVHFYPTFKDTVSLSFLYENRNYETLSDTSFSDYESYGGLLTYQHDFTDWTEFMLQVYREDRQFEHVALNRFGLPSPSHDFIIRPGDGTLPAAFVTTDRERDDDLWEISAAVTQTLSKSASLQLRYSYDKNDSSGEYYQYNSNTVSLIYVQSLPWNMMLQGYTHYRNRKFEHQIANVEEEVLMALSNGDPLPDFDEREDNQFYLALILQKEIIRNLVVALEYNYDNNWSNDDSSEYDVHRVILGVAYEY